MPLEQNDPVESLKIKPNHAECQRKGEPMATSQTQQYKPISEVARRYNLSENWLYQRSRLDKLPGQVRLGKHIRIDVAVFDAAVRSGELQ